MAGALVLGCESVGLQLPLDDEASEAEAEEKGSDDESTPEEDPDGPGEEPEEPAPVAETAYLYLSMTDGTIEVYEIDDRTGGLTQVDTQQRVGGRISYMAFDPNAERLYAANRDALESYSLTDDTVPTYQTEQDADGGGNSTNLEIDVDATSSHVFVSSYGEDLVAMLPLANGVPGAPSTTLGGAGDPTFCENAHQVRVHPGNAFVYAPCLGSDHVAVMAYNSAAGTLTARSPVPTQAGAGPRHMDFHPFEDFVYVANELDSTVNTYRFESDGDLTELQSISSLTAGPDSFPSDIKVHPSGQFVYSINRRPSNTIAVFSVGVDGTLSLLANTPAGADHARAMAIHQSGDWLYVGGWFSDNLVVFSIDQNTGALTQVDELTGFSDSISFAGIRYVPES